MNSMRRQNDRILKEELPRSVGAQYATGDQWKKITPERMKGWSQSKNNTQLWMRLVIEARSNARYSRGQELAVEMEVVRIIKSFHQLTEFPAHMPLCTFSPHI